MRLVFGGLQTGQRALQSSNIMRGHQSEAFWENKSTLQLSVIYVQQDTSEMF